MEKQGAVKGTTMGTKLAWCMRDVGFAFSWGVVNGFITMYYTDSVGLSAAFAGTMMLVCRLLDGISDLIAGFIIEKTTSKLGKCRFWFCVSIVPLAISMILLFNVPANISMLSKQVYATITYIFMAVICYTMANIAYNSLLSRFTITSDDVVSASAMRVVLAIGASLAVSMSLVGFLNLFGGMREPKAWRTMAIVFACCGLILQLFTAIIVKERQNEIAVEASESAVRKEKTNLAPIFKTVLSNKNFWIICAEQLLINAFFMGLYVYYARDVLGNENYVGIINLLSMGPVILLQPILPKLVRSFGKRRVMLVGAVLVAFQGLITFISPYNAIVVFIAMAIGGIGRGAFMGLIFTLTADLVDYFKETKGIESEGVCYSTTSIGTKLGSGLGLAIIGWTLEFGHYDATLAQQKPETIQAMINLMGIGVLVIGILMFAGIYFLDFNKNKKVENV